MSDLDNLKDRAFATLRDAIVSGELEDGSQSSVYQLADRLGMSRTPVREAVLQLAESGLLTVEKNRGVRIHGMTVVRLRDVFEFRLLLEVPAAAFATDHADATLHDRLRDANEGMTAALDDSDERSYRRHDRALHDRITDLAGNGQISAALNTLRQVHNPQSPKAYGGRDPRAVITEHVAIANAIAAGDASAAGQAMRSHLVNTGTLLMRSLAERTGESVDPGWADRLAVPRP